MVRVYETNWLKCGIEPMYGVQYVSAVVTRDWSDWSVMPLNNPPAVWLRVVRQAVTLEAYFSLDGVLCSMFRQAFLGEAPMVEVGPMPAAPIGSGFIAQFDGFYVVEAGG